MDSEDDSSHDDYELRVGWLGTGTIKWSLIHFSTSSLPSASGTTLDNAILYFYTNVATPDGSRVRVVPVDRDFYEYTNYPGPGFDSTSYIAGFGAHSGAWDMANITSYLEGVWQQGSQSNYGLALDIDSFTQHRIISFSSRTGSNPPYVDVSYSCP